MSALKSTSTLSAPEMSKGRAPSDQKRSPMNAFYGNNISGGTQVAGGHNQFTWGETVHKRQMNQSTHNDDEPTHDEGDDDDSPADDEDNNDTVDLQAQLQAQLQVIMAQLAELAASKPRSASKGKTRQAEAPSMPFDPAPMIVDRPAPATEFEASRRSSRYMGTSLDVLQSSQ